MLDHSELLGPRLRRLLTGSTDNSPGILPSMPCTASLSQHALEGPTILARPGDLTIPATLGPLLNYYLVYILLPTAFSYSFSLLYYFPKYRGQNIIFEAGVHLKKKKLLVIQTVKLI